MAISEKQLKANRENAKKGGVNTKEGKLKSRLNAVKHGLLFSQQIILPGEDKEELASLQTEVRFELAPYGQLELLLVDRFISSIWRLRRVLNIERMHILDQYPEVISEDPIKRNAQKVFAESAFINGPSVDIILRYETTIERQMYKTLDKLIELRKIRDKLKRTPGTTPIDRRLPISAAALFGDMSVEDIINYNQEIFEDK